MADFKVPLITDGTRRLLRASMPKMSEITPIPVQRAKDFQHGIREVIETLEANLKPNEELLVYYTNGVEMIRVGHVSMSSTNVAVVDGADSDGNAVRVVAHCHALQFVCKVLKVDEKKEKVKIGFSMN
jgi:hypothetical protein